MSLACFAGSVEGNQFLANNFSVGHWETLMSRQRRIARDNSEYIMNIFNLVTQEIC